MQGLPVYFGEIPNYEVIDGHMHISIGSVVMVMPLHLFLAGTARAKIAIDDWNRRQRCEIVEFPAERHHAASS